MDTHGYIGCDAYGAIPMPPTHLYNHEPEEPDGPDPARDAVLFRTPRTDRLNHNLPVKRGTDICMHVTANGRVYYYLWYWTTEEQGSGTCRLTPATSVRQHVQTLGLKIALPGDPADEEGGESLLPPGFFPAARPGPERDPPR